VLPSSQDLAPCVLIERSSSSRGQPGAQSPRQSEQASRPPSVETPATAQPPPVAKYMSQRREATTASRVASETPRVLPVRIQEPQLWTQTADGKRGQQHWTQTEGGNRGQSDPAANWSVTAAIEHGGEEAGLRAAGRNRDFSNVREQNSQADWPSHDTSKFDSVRGAFIASEKQEGNIQASGSSRAWDLRAGSEPLDGYDIGGGGGVDTSRGARAGSEPWVRSGQRSAASSSGSVSARVQRRGSGERWGKRGDDSTSLTRTSPAAPVSARFFHTPPPPPQRGTWALEHGVGARIGVPPLATRLAVAYGSHGSSAVSTGSPHGQAGWAAALAAVMDIDDAADPGTGARRGELVPTFFER
jgi:hypothetical protein